MNTSKETLLRSLTSYLQDTRLGNLNLSSEKSIKKRLIVSRLDLEDKKNHTNTDYSHLKFK